jgi:Bacterial pre-peptidase C-terminal domain
MSIVTVSDRARGYVFIGLLCSVFWATTAVAQLPPTLPNPRLNYLFPAGGQVGTTFDVTITGDDLDDARQLIFNHTGITAKLTMADPGLGQTGPQPVHGSFQVKISSEIPPGVYELRALGKFGLSNPRAFAVGTLPEIRETEPNNLPKQANPVAIGTTINGTCEGPGLDYFKFSAKKGQRVIIDCWAFRLDSRLDGTLVLYDATGRELERNHNTNRRDPLIDFSVPSDGEYLVSLHDHMYGYYAVPGECFYRLSISTAPYLDFIYPPADLPGSNRQYTVYGRNLPGGKPAVGVEFGGKQLEMLMVTIPLPGENVRDLVRDGGLYVEPSESFMDGISYRLKSAGGISNPSLLTTASAPIVVESGPNTTAARPRLLQPPCEFVGQFFPRGRRDWVSFLAKKGEVYWIEVISQRLGLPTDPRMLVQQIKRDAKGAEQVVDIQCVDDNLANTERVHWSFLDSVLYDMTTHDPVYRFVAPEDGTYRVMVQDLARPAQDVLHAAKGDPRRVYRLSIRRPAPDFRLVAVPRPPTNLPSEAAAQTTIWSPALRPGGAELIEVFADRRDGFEGEIQVTVDNLPQGVTAIPIVIAPGQTSATLVLKAAVNAPPGMTPLNIKGKARIGLGDAVRHARYATMIWAVQTTGVTYHRSRLTDQLCVSVMASEPAPFSLQVDPELRLEAPLTGTVKFPVKVVRRGDFRGEVELFAYGLPPSTSGPLHAQPKYHKPITLPANKDVTEFTITVPGYVPPGTYSFFLSGLGTVSYARNPEKLKAAETRLAVIEKIVAENDARLKTALKVQAAAAKTLADAQAAKADTKTASEAKAASDKTVAEADQKAKQDAAFLLTFRQEVSKLRDQSKATELKISTASIPITLKITPAPFELRLASANFSVKPGAKVELPLSIKRLYGFADPVQVQFLGVHAITGINSPPVAIPPGQSDGRLVIEALGNAPPGTYTSSVQASAAYNGQTLTVRQDLTLTIEPARPAPK